MDFGTIFVSALVSIVSSSITAYVTFRLGLRQAQLKWERELTEKIAQLRTDNSEHAGRLIRQYATGYLVVTRPTAKEREKVFIPSVGRLVIGRAPDSDIVLDDPAVSRHHAMVEVNEGKAFITDLGAISGTYVNDTHLPSGAKSPLSHQDIIRVGTTEMTYMRMQ
jgi:hypothetical protein